MEQAEAEGHFTYIDSRGSIWQVLKQSESLEMEEFLELVDQYKQVEDRHVLIQVVSMAKSRSNSTKTGAD